MGCGGSAGCGELARPSNAAACAFSATVSLASACSKMATPASSIACDRFVGFVLMCAAEDMDGARLSPQACLALDHIGRPQSEHEYFERTPAALACMVGAGGDGPGACEERAPG